MKSLILILNIVIFFSQTAYTQSEVGESDTAFGQLYDRAQSSDPSVTNIWGGEFEYNQVPELLTTMFDDSECTFDNGSPMNLKLPFVPEADRVRPDVASGGMICQLQYGNGVGDKKFSLCTHNSVTCNSIIGGLKKDNIVYVVPAGQNCSSVSAREALLSSFQSNYGGYNVIPASN